ncbi:MAG: hypothetical protein E6Q93_09605 [Burkholderiaceae bacterium]|nr:MAG: hypothetical protein E6Q93_09605 [Burkholderiaceae bacterium]
MPNPTRESPRQLVLPGILLLLAGTAMAQPAADAAQPSLPSKLQYVSPLRAYKPYADQPVESWREANDRVGRIGGWRAYAKEAQMGQPAKDAPQDPVKAPTPAADPHAGHHKGAKP